MIKLIQGDCLEVMKDISDKSIDAVVTDPPYELGFMGKSWDNSGIAYSVHMWKECLRVLKPGGHLLAFGGTRTYHRMAVAIEDAGFEVRDMIEWVYGCLSFDTEVLTERGFRRLHKLTQYDRIGVYDIENNIYKWERPQRWSIYQVNKDTAYRIKSDYTDQIVSRNHRCLVEREGKLVFIQAEELSEMEYMPTLSEDFYSLQEGHRKLLLKAVLRKGKRLAQTLFSKWTRKEVSEQRNENGEEPRLEGWRNLLAKTRKLQANKVCAVSEGVFTDGEKRRLCNGTSFDFSQLNRALPIEDGSSASHQSQSTGQPFGKSDVISIKQGTQITRRARVEKIEYSGIIFCPTVSTGAFIARRNGQVFITGNSGFPKSLNIGKAVDKIQGNEREEFVRNNGAGTSVSGKKTIYGSGLSKADNDTSEFIDTKGTSEWEGWGTALKPSHETIAVAQKPLDTSSDKDYTKSICQTLFAQIVERSSELNLSEKTRQGIVLWSAEKNINTLEDLLEVMGMLQSESVKSLNLNIVLSWLNILADLWKVMNTHTIETELNLTTELKILQSLEWVSIFQNITQAKDNQIDGLSVDVLNVENLLNAVRLKLNYTLTHSAQEDVILQGNKINFAPNHEPICMARKPLSEKTVAENCLKWGTGGINIDESRVGLDGETPPSGSAKRVYAKNQYIEDKVYGGNTETSPLGRFPANLIHDNSEEVRECFPETGKGNGKGAYNYAGREYNNKETSMFNGDKPQAPSNFNDSGNASRFFKSIIYQAKASKSERNKGCEGLEEKAKVFNGQSDKPSEDMKDVEKRFTTLPKANNHPTVKPVALMEYLIRMITPKGGVVLDPFMGSGSTGVAAKKNKFSFIGIEKEPEYIKIAEARIKSVQEPLF